MSPDDSTPPAGWRKSSRCGSGGACVEVALREAAVGMRDSKDPAGLVLVFGADQWRGFLTDLRAGRFDRDGS